MRLPSGLHAAAWTRESCPRSTLGSPEPSAFHTRTVLSSDAETMRWPSGLHEAAKTRSSCPRSTRGCPEPSAFHTRTVLSQDAEAMRLPSGLHVAMTTVSSWPLSTLGSPEPSAFQTRTVLSSPPETMRRPSGLHAADRTGGVVAEHRRGDARRPAPTGRARRLRVARSPARSRGAARAPSWDLPGARGPRRAAWRSGRWRRSAPPRAFRAPGGAPACPVRTGSRQRRDRDHDQAERGDQRAHELRRLRRRSRSASATTAARYRASRARSSTPASCPSRFRQCRASSPGLALATRAPRRSPLASHSRAALPEPRAELPRSLLLLEPARQRRPRRDQRLVHELHRRVRLPPALGREQPRVDQPPEHPPSPSSSAAAELAAELAAAVHQRPRSLRRDEAEQERARPPPLGRGSCAASTLSAWPASVPATPPIAW